MILSDCGGEVLPNALIIRNHYFTLSQQGERFGSDLQYLIALEIADQGTSVPLYLGMIFIGLRKISGVRLPMHES